MAYYNTYNGLGDLLTPEQAKLFKDAYTIAFNCDLTLPNVEDFAAGKGDDILDYYAQRAIEIYPNITERVVLDRLADIEARKKAAQQAAFNTKVIDGGGAILAQIKAENERAKQQAALLPVATPPATPAKKTWKDYLPWILIGGVVAFGAYKMLAGGKKKRR